MLNEFRVVEAISDRVWSLQFLVNKIGMSCNSNKTSQHHQQLSLMVSITPEKSEKEYPFRLVKFINYLFVDSHGLKASETLIGDIKIETRRST